MTTNLNDALADYRRAEIQRDRDAKAAFHARNNAQRAAAWGEAEPAPAIATVPDPALDDQILANYRRTQVQMDRRAKDRFEEQVREARRAAGYVN